MSLQHAFAANIFVRSTFRLPRAAINHGRGAQSGRIPRQKVTSTHLASPPSLRCRSALRARRDFEENISFGHSNTSQAEDI